MRESPEQGLNPCVAAVAAARFPIPENEVWFDDFNAAQLLPRAIGFSLPERWVFVSNFRERYL